MNEQFIKALYDSYGLSSKGKYEDFKSAMDNPAFRKAFHEGYLSKNGSYDQFESALNEGATPQQTPIEEPQKDKVLVGSMRAYGISKPQAEQAQVEQPPVEQKPIQSTLEPTEVPATLQGTARSVLPTKAPMMKMSQGEMTDLNKYDREEVTRYVPESVDSERLKLDNLRKKDEQNNGVLYSLERDAKRKTVLADYVLKEKQQEAIEDIQLYAKNRLDYYQSISKTDKDVIDNNKKLEADIKTYQIKKQEELKSAVTPYYEEAQKSANNPILVQSQKSKEFKQGFESIANRPQISYNFEEDSYVDNLLKIPYAWLSKATSALFNQFPAGYYSSRASMIDTDYDKNVLLSSYLAKNRIPKPAGASPEWERDQTKAAVEDRIAQVGDEQYQKEKTNYVISRAQEKVNFDKKAQVEKGEMAARGYGLTDSYKDAIDKGIFGVGEYAAGMIGQVQGLAAPTMLVGALNPPSGVSMAAGVLPMMMIEKGEAYNEGVDILQEKYPNLTRQQIYEKDLDADLRDASTRTGLINGALEHLGQLGALGKAIPKNKVAELVDILIKRLPAKGAGRVSFASFIEGTTEWFQRKTTRINNYIATEGMSLTDAFNKAMAEDDSEDFVGGSVGGGGMRAISEVANKIERRPFEKAGYTAEELDLFSKNPDQYRVTLKTETGKKYITDRAGKLILPESKKKELIRSTMDSITDQVASTGNPGIDSDIDATANEILNDQENQKRVSGAEQQGQAPVQEGTQPQVSGAETTPSGVLQVPGETSRAETQVTPTAEVAQPAVSQPVTVKEGDKVTLPPVIQGGLDRNFVYNQGEWKQSVGGELVSVPSKAVQDQAQSAFQTQTPVQEMQPAPQVTPAAETTVQPAVQPATKPVEVTEGYTIDDSGNVHKVKVSKKNDRISSVTFEDNTRTYRTNAEIFNTEEEAKAYLPKKSERVKLVEDLQQAKNNITTAENTDLAISEYNKAKQKLEEFDKSQATVEQAPTEVTPTVTQPTVKTTLPETGTAYVYDNETGAVVQGEIVRKNDRGISVKINGKNTYRQPSEVFATEQEAKDYGKTLTKQSTEVQKVELEPYKLSNEEKSTLRDAGYTDEQIKMIDDNPDVYQKQKNKIVKVEDQTTVKPKGAKTLVKRKRKPTLTRKTVTPDDVYNFMFEPPAGATVIDLLEMVYSEVEENSPLAKLITRIVNTANEFDLKVPFKKATDKDLKILKENKGLAYYELSENYIVYSPVIVNAYHQESITTLSTNEKIRNEYRKAYPSLSNLNDADFAIRVANHITYNEVLSTAVHESIHAFTSRILYAELGDFSRKNTEEGIESLKNYLAVGKNNNVKEIIRCYIKTLEQYEGQKNDTYGLTDMHEFLAEAFSNPDFQKQLNEIDYSKGVSVFKKFWNAIKGLFSIDVKAGSVLERTLFYGERLFESKSPSRSDLVRLGVFNAKLPSQVLLSPSRFKQNNFDTYLSRAKELIASGEATIDNVIDKLQEEIATARVNVDLDAIEADILASLKQPAKGTAPTGVFDADELVDDFFENGTMTPETQRSAVTMVENIADYLRGTAKTLEDVKKFVSNWNSKHPDNKLSANQSSNIWDRIKTPKPVAEKVTMSINQIIEDRFKSWAKGKTQGVKETTKQFRENLIGAVREAIKMSNLTPTQINYMLAAVNKVNLFTPGSIGRLKERIRKIEESAAYADKLKKAYSLRRKLLKVSRTSTNKIVQNYNQIAKDLRSVDVRYLADYNGKDAVDAYIETVESVLAGYAKVAEVTAGELGMEVDAGNYKPIVASEIQDYINEQNKNAAIQQAMDTFDITEQEAEEYVIEGMALADIVAELKKEKQKELASYYRDVIQDMRPALDLVSDPDNKLSVLKNAKLDNVDFETLAAMVKVIDNVIVNNDFSMVDMISNKIAAIERIDRMMDKILGKALGKIGQTKFRGRSLQDYVKSGLNYARQITQIFDAIFKNNVSNSIFYAESGLYDYNAGTARAEIRRNRMAEGLLKAIDNIDKKYPKSPSIRQHSEISKLLILSELGKYVVDSKEHIETVKANIEKSIERLEEMHPEDAKVVRKAYDNYKGAQSAEQAIEAFKVNDPHVYELWKYFTTEVWNQGLQGEISLNTKSVHNKSFIPFVNYMPTALTRWARNAEEQTGEPARLSAKPTQANTTKEAKRAMNQQQIYNFFGYLENVVSAYQDTIHDIETSKHLQLFNNVANNANFKEIVGGQANRQVIIDRVISMDRLEKKIGAETNTAIRALNDVANWAAEIGAATALGGLDQAPLQYASAATSALIMLGTDAHLFFASSRALNSKAEIEGIQKLLDKTDVSVRGEMHRLDLGNGKINLKYKNKLTNTLDKAGAGLKNVNRKAIMAALTFADRNAARDSFFAFYLQSLKNQGLKIKNIDLATEYLRSEEPERKQALAYASLMVSNLQVASTTAGRSEAFSNPNVAAVRKILFAFSSFPINTKIRMIHALQKIGYKDNRTEGAQELASVIGEAFVFSFLKIYVLSMWYSLVKAGIEDTFGFEPPEEEEEIDKERKLRTAMLLEANPIGVGALSFTNRYIINFINFKMSETEARTINQFLKEENDPVLEKMYDMTKYQDFAGLGQYGIGLQRFADAVEAGYNISPVSPDYVTMDSGFEETLIEKNTKEIEDLMWLDFAIQYAPMFREIRIQANKIKKEQMKKLKESQNLNE